MGFSRLLLGYVSVVSFFILVLDCRLFSFFLKSTNIQFVELVFQESQSHIRWYVYVSLIKLGKKKESHISEGHRI